jgi:hypothetical protein
VIVGAARVSFTDAKLGVNATREVVYAAPLREGPLSVDWKDAARLDIPASGLLQKPEANEAVYRALPAAALQPKNYAAWQKAFVQWLMASQSLELLRHAGTKLTSLTDEDPRAFATRVRDALREARDRDVEAVRKKLGTKRQALEDKLRRAEAAVQREEQQVSQQKTQTMLSTGAAMIGALFGRKVLSTGTLGRATTAARGVGRTMKEAEDVKRAAGQVTELRVRLEAFDEGVRQETQAIAARYDEEAVFAPVALAPKRGGVTVHFVGLGWDPR